MIDADEGPDPAVSLLENPATEKGSRIVNIAFFVGGEGVLNSFHTVANPDDVS